MATGIGSLFETIDTVIGIPCRLTTKPIEFTGQHVAKAAGVSTATVSAVVHESAFISPELRARVTAAIATLD